MDFGGVPIVQPFIISWKTSNLIGYPDMYISGFFVYFLGAKLLLTVSSLAAMG